MIHARTTVGAAALLLATLAMGCAAPEGEEAESASSQGALCLFGAVGDTCPRTEIRPWKGGFVALGGGRQLERACKDLEGQRVTVRATFRTDRALSGTASLYGKWGKGLSLWKKLTPAEKAAETEDILRYGTVGDFYESETELAPTQKAGDSRFYYDVRYDRVWQAGGYDAVFLVFGLQVDAPGFLDAHGEVTAFTFECSR